MRNKFAVFAALCGIFILIFASQSVISASKNALNICAELILPSLFPFFVISILLAKLGLPKHLERLLAPSAAKLFCVSGAGISALFVGLCGGYPMGAAYIAQLYEDKVIELKEAERLLAFCNNSGPAFIVGVMGAGVFKSAKIGLLLYGIHIFSAVITGLIFKKKFSAQPVAVSTEFTEMSFSQALPFAVKQAVLSVLNVCGFVVCFTVFASLLDINGFLSHTANLISHLSGYELCWSRALLTGIIELGSAAGIMESLSPDPHSIALASALLGWGGISVHFQTLALIADTEIKGTLHFAGRLISAVLSYCLALLLA